MLLDTSFPSAALQADSSALDSQLLIRRIRSYESQPDRAAKRARRDQANREPEGWLVNDRRDGGGARNRTVDLEIMTAPECERAVVSAPLSAKSRQTSAKNATSTQPA